MSKQYYIIKSDGKLRIPVSNDNKTYYGGNDMIGTKYFKRKKDAQQWVEKHTYPYMSYSYIIKEVE